MATPPIIITGAGKRVGFALAQHLLSLGHAIIGSYRSDHPQLDALRQQGAELHYLDCYDPSSVTTFIANIGARHAQLRGIIHNASDWLPDAGDISPVDVISRMLQVHVQVPYQLNLAFEPLLIAGGEESRDIIHITDYVVEKGSKKHAAYAASKAALANLTLSFAARLAPRVKVNSIAPSLILFNQHDTAEYRAKALGKSALQREGGLQEMLAAVDYLLASSYMTGRSLALDGGRNVV